MKNVQPYMLLKDLKPEHQEPIVAMIEGVTAKHGIPAASVVLIGGYDPNAQGRISIGFSIDDGESLNLTFDTHRLAESVLQQATKLDVFLTVQPTTDSATQI